MATLAELAVEAADLHEMRRWPSTRTQVVFGVGDPHAPLMFVGEAPGKDEDEQGEPFVGRSGKLLDQVMQEETRRHPRPRLYREQWKCRPPGNRDPLPDEIATCRPWLEAKLDLIAPKVVITLGNFATKVLLFGDPKAKEGITKLRGKSYPWRNGAVLVPTFHPSAVLRSGGGQPLAQMRADFIRAKRALADAGVVAVIARHARARTRPTSSRPPSPKSRDPATSSCSSAGWARARRGSCRASPRRGRRPSRRRRRPSRWCTSTTGAFRSCTPTSTGS